MNTPVKASASGPVHPLRRALLRGLAVILPPLLTIVVFLWAWTMIDTYILIPCENIAGQLVVWTIRDVKSGVPDGAVVYRDQPQGPVTKFDYKGTTYVPIGASNKFIPATVFNNVVANPLDRPPPVTANAFFEHYAQTQFLRRERTLPMFLAAFVLVLYLTGKFMAAGVGRYIRHAGERVVDRMPIVRDVYSATKQITDSIFSEQEVQFLRVVAVEYPRKGLWQIAFVTGEGFKDIHDVAGEPIVCLLMSHSPVPATGFTCIALKRDTIDLNITVDQAVQFIVSCGVVIPPHQQWNARKSEIGDDITRQVLKQTEHTVDLIQSA